MKNQPIPLSIISLGCAKNLVDTEIMAGTLAQAGVVLTADASQAKVLLINTCAFVADARSEAVSQIEQAMVWKKQQPGRRVIVAGCLPQRDLPRLREAFAGVDLFIGLDDVPRIAALLENLLATPKAKDKHPGADSAGFKEATYLYDETAPRLLLTPSSHAYIKIAEGCDHRCKFCAIPGIRGRQRSRAIPSVVAECRQLLAQDVREINLIAQDTTSYGRDRKDGTTLAALLRECDELEGYFWIRVLYMHPKHVTDELLDVMAAAKHVVPYIDIPLQHISDGQLHAMARGMGSAETRALMEKIRRKLPGITLRTTFLTGYPGETDADFEELLAYVKAFKFDRLGVFTYSPEEGTPAAEITEGLVPVETAEHRRDLIMRAQQEIALAKNKALVGKTLEVVLDTAEAGGKLTARTKGDAPDVDNVVHVKAPKKLLDQGFLAVRVTGATHYELTAVPAAG
jgi:ribosomal protein S12 methylthiotransferase